MYCFHLYHISMIRKGKCSSKTLQVVYQTIWRPRGSKLYFSSNKYLVIPSEYLHIFRLLAETVIYFWLTESSVCWLHDCLNPLDCNKQFMTPRIFFLITKNRVMYTITPLTVQKFLHGSLTADSKNTLTL